MYPIIIVYNDSNSDTHPGSLLFRSMNTCGHGLAFTNMYECSQSYADKKGRSLSLFTV